MHASLEAIDYAIIALYMVFALGVGSLFFSQAGQSLQSFFVGDRKLPWWLAGTSIVATTFAADTPLAITGIVATDGVSGNWIWWCWAIAHLSATFFFARMWRRAGVITDAEITELRYRGRAAAALRGIKAVYFGLFINCLTMAWVIAAMVKISAAFFDLPPPWVIAACVAGSVAYTTLGGFRGVVVTDLAQFALGMAGAVALAWCAADHFGGLGALPVEGGDAGRGLLGALATSVEASGGRVEDVTAFFPPTDHPTLPPIYLGVLLLAGWWRYAEGNGYIVQRLAACRDEGQAQGASLWFAVAHNALRPWPWIVVALAALVIFPRLPDKAPEELRAGEIVVRPATIDAVQGGTLRFEGLTAGCAATLDGRPLALTPQDTGHAATVAGDGRTAVLSLAVTCPQRTATLPLRTELLDREMGYPLMMGRFLPPGLLGLVIASLLAAFMSTIDTHTNWGASYLVQDLYKRFVRPEADPAHYVRVSRACIALMGVLAGVCALFIGNIATVWKFLVTLGAGLGSVTAARWYWSRVTPQAEFAAMGATTLMAVGLEVVTATTLLGADNPLFLGAIPTWARILMVAGVSLAAWVPVALLGPRNDPEVLRAFVERVNPPGPGWAAWRQGPAPGLGRQAAGFVAGLGVVFGALAGLGELVMGDLAMGLGLLAGAGALLAWIVRGAATPASTSDPAEPPPDAPTAT